MLPRIKLVIPLLVLTQVRGTGRAKVALVTRVSDFLMRAFDVLLEVGGAGSDIRALITRVPNPLMFITFVMVEKVEPMRHKITLITWVGPPFVLASPVSRQIILPGGGKFA